MIDDLLRDLEIPESLKSDLRAIPDQCRTELPPTRPKRWKAAAAIIAVAAAVVMLASVIHQLQSNPDVVQQSDPSPRTDPSDENRIAMELAESDELDQLQLDLERARLQWKIATLRQRAALNSKGLPESVEANSATLSHEKLALVKGLSCQAALDWGAPPESVRFELQSVVDKFDGTQGAAIATQILKQYD